MKQLREILKEGESNKFYMDIDEMKLNKVFNRFYKSILPLFGVKLPEEIEVIEQDSKTGIFQKKS